MIFVQHFTLWDDCSHIFKRIKTNSKLKALKTDNMKMERFPLPPPFTLEKSS